MRVDAVGVELAFQQRAERRCQVAVLCGGTRHKHDRPHRARVQHQPPARRGRQRGRGQQQVSRLEEHQLRPARE